jgi:O-antigen ligase
MVNEKAAPVVVVIMAAVLALLLGGFMGLLGGELLIVAVMALVLGGLLLYSPALAICLFIFVMPYNGSELIPRLAQNVVFFGVVALFLGRYMMRQTIGKPLALPMPREMLLYILLVTAATAVGTLHLKEMSASFMFRSGITSYGLKEYVLGLYAKQMSIVVVAGMIAAAVIEKRGRVGWIVAVTIASAVLFVGMMLVILAQTGFSFDQLRTSRRFFAQLGRQNNGAGGLLFLAFASTLFMWQVAKGKMRLLLFLVSLVLMGGVVLTASRGAILGLATVLLVYVIQYRRLRAAFAVALIATLGFAFAPESVQERMLQGLQTRYSIVEAAKGPGDEVTSGRLDIWRQLAPEVLRNPVFGRGLFSTQWSDYARNGGYWATHPHNMYLGIAMDTGIIGVIIMFIFYRYLWRGFRRLGTDDRLSPLMRGYFSGAAAGLAGYLVFGVPNGFFHPSTEQIYLWVSIGLMVGYTALLGARQPVPVQRPDTARSRPDHRWRAPVRG